MTLNDKNKKDLPLVSVVITTKNEEANIENCLNSLTQQSYPQSALEIIVVDNNSTDNTKKISQSYTDKIFNFGPERSAQRNFGIRESAGHYALFLDADMILTPDVIKDCVSALENNKDIVAAYISETILGERYFSKVRRFERSFYDASVIDCVRFFKREAFLEIGGFDESMSGPEDWDIDKKFRQIGKTTLVQTPILHNEAEFELGPYLKKKSYYAQSFDTYIQKWGKNDPDVQKQFGLVYRFFGVFTENGKWKKLITSPHYTVGMYFLRFLVGLSFLRRNHDK